ncbi:hypothetical protein DFH09DRAFT_479239 [Mycena vulgaris]|nr:hypothetical protein DFH09DRAFT_479239 [Mycena vulgaris]
MLSSLAPPSPSPHPLPSPSHFQTPMHLSSRPIQADAGAPSSADLSMGALPLGIPVHVPCGVRAHRYLPFLASLRPSPRSPRRRTHPRAERLLLLPLAHLPVLARIVLQHLVEVEQPQRVERGEHGELEEGMVGPREYWDERRRGGGTKGWVYAQDGQSLLATALARVQVDTPASTDPAFPPAYALRTRRAREPHLAVPRRACRAVWHAPHGVGRPTGKDVGMWFGPSAAAGAVRTIVGAFPTCGFGVSVATDGTLHQTEVFAMSHSPGARYSSRHSSASHSHAHSSTRRLEAID